MHGDLLRLQPNNLLGIELEHPGVSSTEVGLLRHLGGDHQASVQLDGVPSAAVAYPQTALSRPHADRALRCPQPERAAVGARSAAQAAQLDLLSFVAEQGVGHLGLHLAVPALAGGER